MIDMNFKYKRTIEFLEEQKPFYPQVAIILGSGLGDFAESLNTAKSISTAAIPDYPASTVVGHSGKIHFSIYEGLPLLLFQGRIHLYEGYKLNQCMLPVFLSHELGCKTILLTNAAGGINPSLMPGDLMLNTSFNSLFIKKEMTELLGLASIEKRNNLIDFPSQRMNRIIHKAASDENIILKEGVYWYNKGPSYETPAEIKMMSASGGDAVGMSTAHEALFASTLNMEVASISCITNYAAGITLEKLSHEDVTSTANKVKATFEKLLKRIISELQVDTIS
ncbi:MAG: purine-nucleoside phosphorylase [Ignavibacteriales bacterium]|nr:MAG: purine-nucleoside phosphorylase [Ignavibacteriales bacterium]